MIMTDSNKELHRPKFPEGASTWWALPRKDLNPEQLELKRKYDRELRAFLRNDPEKKQKDLEAQRRCTIKNKEKVYQRNQEWRKNNWEKVYKQRQESGSQRRGRNKWYHNKGKYDTTYVIAGSLRARVRSVLNGNVKSASTMELLGCSMEFFKQHLENQFVENMTWDNYGDWHIDHIIPCCSFDLSIAEEQKKCFNYVNLRPLWGYENLLKAQQDKKMSIKNKKIKQ